MLSQLLPAVDWTEAARANQLAPAVESHTARIDCEDEKETQPDEPLGRQDDIYDTMARILYRQTNRHLLVTGQKGVGKTATIRELARKAALGEILFPLRLTSSGKLRVIKSCWRRMGSVFSNSW